MENKHNTQGGSIAVAHEELLSGLAPDVRDRLEVRLEEGRRREEKVKDLSPLQFAEFLIEDVERRLGCNLKAFLLAQRKSPPEQCRGAIFTFLADAFEKYHADKPNSCFHGVSVLGADNPGEFQPSGNAVKSYHAALEYSQLREEEILDEMMRSQSHLAQIVDARSEEEVSVQTYLGGYLALTIAGGYGFLRAWEAGAGLFECFMAGARSMYKLLAYTVIAMIVVWFVFWIFFKQAQLQGFVINMTKDDLFCKNYQHKSGNLIMNTGKMTEFMDDLMDPQSPKTSEHVQIRGMINYGGRKALVFCGWYFAEKRDGESYGADGAMILSNRENGLRVAHEFAVPHSKSNGTNIKLLDPNSDDNAKEVFSDLRNSQKVTVVTNDSGYELTSCVNSKSGGLVALCASVRKPDDAPI